MKMKMKSGHDSHDFHDDNTVHIRYHRSPIPGAPEHTGARPVLLGTGTPPTLTPAPELRYRTVGDIPIEFLIPVCLITHIHIRVLDPGILFLCYRTPITGTLAPEDNLPV